MPLMCTRCHHDPVKYFNGLCGPCKAVDDEKAKLKDEEADAEGKRLGQEESDSTDSRDLLASEAWFLHSGDPGAPVMQHTGRTVVTVQGLQPGRSTERHSPRAPGEEGRHRRAKSGSVDWDQRFLQLAQHVAEWSKDPSTKVGSVIVDAKRKILGVGYNGYPRGVQDEQLEIRYIKLSRMVHAEMNAILNTGLPSSLEGATLYATLYPCQECAKAIIQSGITRVVYRSTLDKWKASHECARDMFDQANVEVEVR